MVKQKQRRFDLCMRDTRNAMTELANKSTCDYKLNTKTMLTVRASHSNFHVKMHFRRYHHTTDPVQPIYKAGL